MKPQVFDSNPYASPNLSPLVAESELLTLVRRFKSKNQVLITLATLILIALPVAVGIAGMMYFPNLEAAILGVPLIVASQCVLGLSLRSWSDARYGALGRKIGSLLREEQLDPKTWNGKFVQFAPSGKLRLYDNHTEWDVGYFFFFRDRCTYVGTQTRFSVPRSAIRKVTLGHGSIELPFSYQIHIHWLDPTTGNDEALSIWPGAPKLFFQRYEETSEFAEKIRSWATAHEFGTDAPTWSDLPVPALQSVVSKGWQETTPTWLMAFVTVGLVGFVALVTTFAAVHLGQPRWWANGCSFSMFTYCVISTLPRFLVREELAPREDPFRLFQ